MASPAFRAVPAALAAVFCICAAGCHSPLYRDQLALFGALTGAGVGAAVGEQQGDALAGAAIGSAVGAASGATVGSAIDEVEARNRAMIEASLGRQIAGAASHGDIVTMTQAGLGDEVIVTHIQTHGVVPPPSAHDLIRLKNSGVSDAVLQAMQTAALRGPPSAPMPVPAPPPIVVERHVYGPAFHPRPRHRRPHRGIHWGFSISR
jgi:hypothetical protein